MASLDYTINMGLFQNTIDGESLQYTSDQQPIGYIYEDNMMHYTMRDEN